jgi:hypothetical protein
MKYLLAAGAGFVAGVLVVCYANYQDQKAAMFVDYAWMEQ